MRDRAHTVEIERVLRGQQTGRDALVSDSWRRCVETYGMDPTRPDPAHIVTSAELRERRKQSERLIATARSGLQALFRQVAGHNYVLLLADANGVCVDFFGDPRFEDDLKRAGLYLGSSWSEDLAGTCGVGSCIVTGQPVTIHQEDHFGMAHTPLSCTAAPIHDTTGALTAVLDISLLRSPSPKSSQNLAMSLVTAAARRVEMANLMAMTRRDWVLRFSTSPDFLEVDPEAAVALDGSGRILGMTTGVRAALDPDGAGDLIGSRLDDWLELSVDDLPDLMRGRPTEDRVVRLKDGRGLFGHAIAPQNTQAAMRTRQGPPDLPAAMSSLAGPDPAMAALLARAGRLAATAIPLLIWGETGTGKEALARAIHVSGAGGQSFHALRCAGLTDFDGIGPDAPGTLFLRGIEDLGAQAQGALLSLLERRSDLRVIASSRQIPATLAGIIRDDLFYRIAAGSLALPPLRHRADFDWLLDRLLRRRSADGLRLSPAARADLKSRAWPGNLRELAALLDVTVALTSGDVIDLPDLPAPVGEQATSAPQQDLEFVLAACHGNMAQAARRLGVNRSTVLRRLRKAGMVDPG